MNIVLNGERRTLAAEATVADLIAQMGLPDKGVAVERNRAVTPRSRWADERLEEGDRLEIVHFVGGG